MKHVTFVLFLACVCQTIFTQEFMVKRIALPDTMKYDIALNSKSGESLKNYLKIPKDYELRNKIVSQITKQTREKDELGYVHERYDQYYKAIHKKYFQILLCMSYGQINSYYAIVLLKFFP